MKIPKRLKIGHLRMLSRKNSSAPLKRKRVKLPESIHMRQKLKVKKKKLPDNLEFKPNEENS